MMNDMSRPDIQLVDGAGIVKMREVLRIVCYFDRSHFELRDFIRDTIFSYVNLVSINSLPYYYNMEGDPDRLSYEILSEIIEDRFFGQHSWPNANIELIGHGGNSPEYFLWYCGKALDDPEFPDDVGFLLCWVPRGFYLQHTEQIESYVREITNEASICSAYASLGLAGESKFTKQALAKRYCGLDIAEPSSVSVDLTTKVPGSYWITVLGREVADRLGGAAAVRAALDQEISVEKLTGGRVLVKLAPSPESGDRNRRQILPAYRVFARYLHSKGLLHIPQKVVYFDDEQGFSDREAMEGWHRRFLEEK